MAQITDAVDLESPDDVALADKMKSGREQILKELRKTIVGQEDTISQVLLSLFVGGNSLIVGVPGLAKTLLIHTLARVVDGKVAASRELPVLRDVRVVVDDRQQALIRIVVFEESEK